MMKSESEKKQFLFESYDKYHNSITNSELLRTAMYLENKKCCFSITKKHKVRAYHWLMKNWLYKSHCQLLDYNAIEPDNIPIAKYP